jgi:hypothetical protein
MVIVLVSVTTFYASASFDPAEMFSNSTAESSGEMFSNSTAESSGEMFSNSTAESSGEMFSNSTGSIIPSTATINSEQIEKKS